jgi:TRAP-type C4-dicarboxylate transport system permease small subunit
VTLREPGSVGAGKENGARALGALRFAKLATGIIAGLGVLAMMLFMIVDVFARYVLGKAIIGTYDLIQVSMGVVVFGGIAYAGLTSAHITVDLLDELLKKMLGNRGDRFLLAALDLAAGVGLLVVAYVSFARVDDSILFRETTNLLSLPLYPLYALAGVCFGIYGLALLWQAFKGRSAVSGH